MNCNSICQCGAVATPKAVVVRPADTVWIYRCPDCAKLFVRSTQNAAVKALESPHIPKANPPVSVATPPG